MESDAQLVARAKRGDLAAFGALIERYERSVMAVALAELRDYHAAEDVTQTTLLLAYRRLGTLRDESRFGSWLMQIGRREVINVVRSRRVAVSVSLDRKMERVAPDRPAEAWDAFDDLLTLVARLPDHERVLVGLRYFDGNSMSEIARITGRPIGSVTKQLSRAVARLRAWSSEEKS